MKRFSKCWGVEAAGRRGWTIGLWVGGESGSVEEDGEELKFEEWSGEAEIHTCWCILPPSLATALCDALAP